MHILAKKKADQPDDPLINALVAAKGKQVEVIAFGVSYLGLLETVDLECATIILSDGTNKVTLDIERVESFTVIN